MQLVGFFQQFLEIFSELKGKKFYLTGESVSTDLFRIGNSNSGVRAVRRCLFTLSVTYFTWSSFLR